MYLPKLESNVCHHAQERQSVLLPVKSALVSFEWLKAGLQRGNMVTAAKRNWEKSCGHLTCPEGNVLMKDVEKTDCVLSK